MCDAQVASKAHGVTGWRSLSAARLQRRGEISHATPDLSIVHGSEPELQTFACERAALEWTEAVTLIHEGHAADAVYASVCAQFTEKELADLTCVVATINAWNRLSIAARLVPGSYQPAVASH